MRTIKFRFWDGNKMIYNHYYDADCSFNGLLVCEGDTIPTMFTGLLDKNGKEIYEGDIITVDKGGNYKMEVRWRKKTAGFYLSGFKNGKQYIASMCRGFNNFEVVGNIYEKYNN